MSVKTLKSFLIGIGYDTRGLEAGEKRISGSLQGLKSRALQISGALVGAFSAGAASIAATATSVDRLAASTQNLRTSTNAVYNYGNAIRLMGGEASEALEAITRFEEFQNNLRLNGQDGSIDNLARAGINVLELTKTRTGEEFMRALSDMVPRLDEGQRSQVQSTLGLSDYAMRALSGGADQLDELAKKANALAGDIDHLTENSRRLMESSAKLSLAVEGVRNELAEKFLPSLIGASNWLNKLIESNREDISKVIDYAAKNDGATAAVGVSAGASLAGAAASKIGLTAVGGAASRAGTLGLATVAGSVGAHELSQYLNGKLPGYGQASREFDDWLKDVTGLKTIKSPLQLINEVFMPGDDETAPTSPTPTHAGASDPNTAAQEAPPSPLSIVNITHSPGDPPPADIQREAPETIILLPGGEPMRDHGDNEHLPPGPELRDYRLTRDDLDEALYGSRTAVDSISSTDRDRSDKDRQAYAETIAGAFARSPIKVQNQLEVKLQMDGREIDARIIQVNERQNYEAADDLKSTTER
ncbi:hypothetical protein ACTXY8_22740 [Pseudomonas aeruginosa]|nr:hypothetical protein [Pseudomonas aeruginosa]